MGRRYGLAHCSVLIFLFSTQCRNIVNGLRDGDDASVYTRSSFVSEYSAQGGNESPNVFTKGHNRSESKGSVSSFASPNKKGQQGKIRPETKVCQLCLLVNYIYKVIVLEKGVLQHVGADWPIN